jgi:dTDP-4-dehydrorhamnose 3,5-epimerase
VQAAKTKLEGVLLVKPRVFSDDRGFFFESYNEKALLSNDIALHFVQDNHSRSCKNVLRGLHYQLRQSQGKLVRVVSGEIFDVAVDLRRESATFGKWVGEILSEQNKNMLWVPPGFAHGFLVLSEWAEVLYKATDYYAPQFERTIRWDDPDINIDWPCGGGPQLSPKDTQGERLRNAEVYGEAFSTLPEMLSTRGTPMSTYTENSATLEGQRGFEKPKFQTARTGPAPNLTSGCLLARNTIWNLLGQLLPMTVGVVAIPPLVRSLGVDRVGVLSLAWIVIGYFSLFDLGMGRALTKLVADKIGGNDEASIPPLAWTSLALMLALGVLGGLITLGIAPWLVYRALKVPPALQLETLRSFQLLAASIPLVTVTSGLRGILEAQQRFRVLNFIRIPTSIFSFAGPLFVLPFSHSLVPIIVVLMIGRLLGALAHLLACFHALPALRHNMAMRCSVVAPLIKFGGWMTVSNVLGPLMVYADRFLIGALLSVGAVAYYTTPFDLVGRLSFIPAAVTGVLFPAFAASLSTNRERAALLSARGVKYIFLAMFPVILVTVTFAPDGLRLWLGPVFASHSQSVLRWLATGFFINALANVPFVLIQGAGRPSLTAKLHMLELPLYIGAVWMLTRRLGIEGAAIAFTARVVLDTVVLFFLADRMLRHEPRFMTKLAVSLTASLVVLAAATLPHTIIERAVFCLLALLAFGLVACMGMAPDERDLVRRLRRKALKVQSSSV